SRRRGPPVRPRPGGRGGGRGGPGRRGGGRPRAPHDDRPQRRGGRPRPAARPVRPRARTADRVAAHPAALGGPGGGPSGRVRRRRRPDPAPPPLTGPGGLDQRSRVGCVRNDEITLTAGDAEVTVRPGNGGRIQGLRVGGTELLRQGERFGCFPMVPWCGRIRDGRFRDGATVHQLPLNAPPNAIHGTARDAAWRTARAGDGEAVLTHDLAEPWPYPGRVTQQIELAPDSLTLTMSVETYESSCPAQIGWHPWFLRNLGGADAVLDFAPAWQEERGDDHLPTGRRVDPRPGPWDDCFGMPGGVDVTLTWPGQLRLTVTSREEWVVIYDEQREAVCVEPQTGPPDGLNTAPRLVTPLEPLEASTTWTWARL